MTPHPPGSGPPHETIVRAISVPWAPDGRQKIRKFFAECIHAEAAKGYALHSWAFTPGPSGDATEQHDTIIAVFKLETTAP